MQSDASVILQLFESQRMSLVFPQNNEKVVLYVFPFNILAKVSFFSHSCISIVYSGDKV